MKLQFNRLHSLTWILSIKMRTVGACWGGAKAPRAPPLVTGLKLQQYFWKNYVQQSERFHWQTHNWQSSSQYGFAEHIRLNMSYLIWLNLSVPIWTKNKILFSCWGFIDLKKAFDTVDHKIFILDKLNYYGFREIVNRWFFFYLTNRTQTLVKLILTNKTLIAVHHKALF